MSDGLNRNGEATPVEMFPGIVRRTLSEGSHTMLCELRMKAGSVVPAHTHPHEQTGYLASGRFRFRLNERWQELGPGDSWCVPGGVEHEVEVLEDSIGHRCVQSSTRGVPGPCGGEPAAGSRMIAVDDVLTGPAPGTR